MTQRVNRYDSTAIWELLSAVREAIALYDKSRDHIKHSSDSDCIRCRLAEIVGGVP